MKTKKNKFPNESLEYSDGSVRKVNVKIVKGWATYHTDGTIGFLHTENDMDIFKRFKLPYKKATLHIKPCRNNRKGMRG